MVKTDLVPDLLDAIHEQFDQHYAENQTIQRLLKKLEEKKNDYVDAYHYAKQVGEALSRTLGQQVTVDILPNGKMYYNIAERVMSDTLHHNYELVSDYAAQTQQTLNDKAGIHIKAQRAEYNVEKADGLIQTLTSKEDFEKGKWLLKAPVETFTMSVVDDTVRKNLEFHAKAGLRPRIIRRAAPDCCDWCNAIAGEYLYGQEPSEVFRRHDNCECICTYDPGDGAKLRQDVWSKSWASEPETEKREARILAERKAEDQRARQKQRAVRVVESGAKHYHRNTTTDAFFDTETIRREKHAYLRYEGIKNSNQSIEKRKIFDHISQFPEMKDFTKEDVDIAFDHVFNDLHDLENGRGLFTPDFDMAQSWDRLINGRGIQPHDLMLLRHERLERDYMQKEHLSFDKAHDKTNLVYNYTEELHKDEGR